MRHFTDADYDAHRRVALVGSTVAKDLAGGDGTSLVGQTVTFNGKQFTVIGILASKGSSGSAGPGRSGDRPSDSRPGHACRLRFAVVHLGQGDLGDDDHPRPGGGRVDPRRPSWRDFGRPRLQRFSASSILSAATSSSETLTVLLGVVAAISLLVGGIGVMNIMLVSVTERTREIGIRKAIGARRSDLIGQFLLEAAMLTLFGGLIGVVVGVIGAQFTILGVQPVIAPYSVLLAFGVAIAVGLVFGIYPANRAAALRPIDALRFNQ